MPKNKHGNHNVFKSAWYTNAMARLVDVVQELSHARDMDTVIAIVREEARNLTGADGATFVLRDGDNCYYVEENAISPLWKGRRFPMNACISGWVMQNARSAVIEDIYRDPRVPGDAYRPTFVKSLAMVPIRRNNPIGAIGNYWAKLRRPTEEEVAILQALADTTSVAMENVQLYDELTKKVHILEEQQVHICEQRDTLALFTHALAHDLKEPLRTIRSFAGLIKQHESSSEKRDEYFRYIQSAADRMAMLIESVFHYFQLDNPDRIPKEQLAMTDVVDEVKETLKQLIRDSKAVITSKDLPEVYANPVQMMQLIQNLLSNALHHSGKAATAVHIQTEETIDNWLFSVSDDGLGIASEQLENIFQPFKRLTHNENCSGLGLATCRKIVEAHGGKIWCESSAGQGATFFFTLPKLKFTIDEPGPKKSPGQPVAQTTEMSPLANLLLVDDARSDIELARLQLFRNSGLQCNLMVAHDGKEALNILKETTQKGDIIDLMLLDINMPVMSGFELLQYIRKDKALKEIKVVMCTGSIHDQDRECAESLGAVGYMVKPPSFEMLKLILDRIPSLDVYHGEGSNRLLRVSNN